MNPDQSPIASKYTRSRRRVSLVGIFIGLIVGVAGGLFFAWNISPREEIDIAPWQLSVSDKDQYIVAIALRYAQDNDLTRAINSLVNLRVSGDPIQAVADTACRLATSGYVNSTSGLNAVRSMIALYQPQARAGCADEIIPAMAQEPTMVVEITLPTATNTLLPPPTKSPTPASVNIATSTPVPIVIPTSPPQSNFELISVTTDCSVTNSGLIQVYVYEANGSTGVPAQQIRVRWSGDSSIFFTGLKPELGRGYADFLMTEGQNYIVDLPGQSDPIREALAPVPCNTETGERALITYRVIYRRSG